MGILLTMLEMGNCLDLYDEDCYPSDNGEVCCVNVKYVAKAQAIKLLDELEKPCPCPRDKFSPAIPKRECSFCMLQIRKELE